MVAAVVAAVAVVAAAVAVAVVVVVVVVVWWWWYPQGDLTPCSRRRCSDFENLPAGTRFCAAARASDLALKEFRARG